MDWSTYYPAYIDSESVPQDRGCSETEARPIRRINKEVTVADIGCGFGGLLVALAPKLPEELLLGMDIPRLLSSQDS